MPIKQASYKSVRKDKKRHLRNIDVKSDLKTRVKKFQDFLVEKNIDKAKEYLKDVISKFDKAVTHGIIHKNTASRKKSRLTKSLAKLLSQK